MYTTAFLAATLAALASAAPAAKKRDSTYYGISLNLNVADAFSTPVYEPAPVEINVLTSLGNTSVSEISFDSGVHVNVDLNSVECRAYKDDAGVVPGSAPFTSSKPAEISTNLDTVGSVLCYILTEAEVDSSS